MNTSPASPAAGRRSPDDESGDRSDMELDMMFALDPLDEAIDVAFAAVEAAQQAARTIPETAAPAKFRDEWRTHNARGPSKSLCGDTRHGLKAWNYPRS
jgi:hypothetical protein